MLDRMSKKDCCGCGLCAALCPARSRGMARDSEGFDYPSVTQAECLRCGLCEKLCPMTAERPAERGYRYLGAKALSDEIRGGSSSGGVFPVLAAHILGLGGVVFGAAFGEAFVLKHRAADSVSRLRELTATKYIQSSQEDVYGDLAAALSAGKWVLYTGTPCCCEGVLRYVEHQGLPTERLLVMDLVCYGVPSPGLWQDYVRYLEKKHGGKLTSYQFRDKSRGDHGRSVRYEIGGRTYIRPLWQDLYCALYFHNYSIRPSCHRCPFTTVDRNTDITAGDFWGVEHIRPEFDDGMGVSMVILRSKKAKGIWEEISSRFAWFACEEKDVMQKEQPRLQTPTAPAAKRELFYFLYRHLPFSVLAVLLWNGKGLRRFWR